MSEKKEETKPAPAAESGKKWYKSTTIQAVCAAIVVLVVLPRFGVEVPAEYSTEVYAALASAVIIGLRKASGKLAI